MLTRKALFVLEHILLVSRKGMLYVTCEFGIELIFNNGVMAKC